MYLLLIKLYKYSVIVKGKKRVKHNKLESYVKSSRKEPLVLNCKSFLIRIIIEIKSDYRLVPIDL